MVRFDSLQPGEEWGKWHVLLLAPTGMGAYHMKGSTVHSALRINSGEFSGLSGSELKTLRTRFLNLKGILMDEMSMTRRNLFINFTYRLREVIGTTKPFCRLHIITFGDFSQVGTGE